MTHITCRLTAKNRDQLRNPTLGNQVWATFTFLPLSEDEDDRQHGVFIGGAPTIDVKNVFNVFLFWSRFLRFQRFLFSKRFYFKKKRWQSSERQAD